MPCHVRGVRGAGGVTAFSAFGIFDGHGGKQACAFASKHLMPAVAKFLDRVRAPPPASLPHVEGAVESDSACWAVQDAMVERLPRVSCHAVIME